MIGRGASNDEIADQLVITEATVKTHITRIFFNSDVDAARPWQ
jgi:DNA-binding NarL/FixJ family response regulator